MSVALRQTLKQTVRTRWGSGLGSGHVSGACAVQMGFFRMLHHELGQRRCWH